MKRRQFLTLLAAGASLAVPMKGISSVLDDSVSLSGEKDCDSTSQAQQLTSTTETALPMPIQILDLHSHMFNCRYLPLESIIYDALKKSRIFAKLVAQILYRMTESSYETPQSRQNLMRKATDPGQDTNPELIDEYYINEIAEMAKYELLLTTHSPEIMQQGLDLSNKMSPTKEAYPSLINSDLFDLISQLEKVPYEKEWEAAIPTSRLPPLSIKTLNARRYGSLSNSSCRNSGVKRFTATLRPSLHSWHLKNSSWIGSRGLTVI